MKPEYAKYRNTDIYFKAFESGEFEPETECKKCIFKDVINGSLKTQASICGLFRRVLDGRTVGCLGGAKLPEPKKGRQHANG